MYAQAREIRTEYDADEREDDQLRNNQESEVACDDGAVQPRLSLCTLILREPSHDNGKEEAE